MPRIKGERKRAGRGYLCSYCDQSGAQLVVPGLHACADSVACSNRMQQQGMGRRDWTETDRAIFIPRAMIRVAEISRTEDTIHSWVFECPDCGAREYTDKASTPLCHHDRKPY